MANKGTACWPVTRPADRRRNNQPEVSSAERSGGVTWCFRGKARTGKGEVGLVEIPARGLNVLLYLTWLGLFTVKEIYVDMDLNFLQ